MAVRRRVLTFLLLCAALPGCGGGSPTAVAPPVTPIEPLPALTKMNVLAPGDSIATGQAIALSVQAFDEKARPMDVGLVAWASSNPLVARVGSDGVLLCLTAGVTTISATVGSVSGSRVLTLTPRLPGPLPVVSTFVTPVSLSMEVGQVGQVQTRLTDFAGDTLTGRAVSWSSSNDTVATVTAAGVVTARARGTALIDAVSEGVHGAALIVVSPAVDTTLTITVAAPRPGIDIGDTVTVVATVHAFFPMDSVTVSIGGITTRMILGAIPGSGKGPAWVALANISSLSFGANFIIVTAYDNRGKYAINVVPFNHNPRVNGGSKAPSASK